ncbi:hypothetical protein ACS1W8_005909, partial [Escherichia coli]
MLSHTIISLAKDKTPLSSQNKFNFINKHHHDMTTKNRSQTPVFVKLSAISFRQYFPTSRQHA